MFEIGEEHRNRETCIFKFFHDPLYRYGGNHYLREPTRSCRFPSSSRSCQVLRFAENDKTARLNREPTINVRRIDRGRYTRTTFTPGEGLLNVWQIGLRFFPVGFHRAIYTFSHFLVEPPRIKYPHCGITVTRMLEDSKE